MLGFNDETQNEQFVQALSVAINQTFTLKQEASKNEAGGDAGCA